MLLIFSFPVFSADFNASWHLQYDNGREVDPQSSEVFPDNRTDRSYFEGLLTAELLFAKLPMGDNLRLGIRFLEFQPSDVDGIVYGFDDKRRIDDKLYAQLKWNRWEFWGGDVYETFGRGLSLNLFENRDLYFDSGLRGSKVTYRSKALRFKAIYGQSRSWYLVKKERLGGINLEYKPARSYLIGANLVFQDGLTYERRFIPGAYGQAEVGPVTVYYEYAQSRLDDDSTKTDFSLISNLSRSSSKQGDGSFLGIDTYFAGITAQFNYKYYKFHSDNPFQTPPTAQREYTTHLLTSHPHLPLIDDQVGFEIDLAGYLYDLVYLNLNFSRASDHEGTKLLPSLHEDYSPFWELYLEGESDINDRTKLKLGAGWNEEARSNFWQEKIGLFGETVYSLTDLWSLTLSAENMWVDDKEAEKKHNDYWLSTTVARSSFGSLNLSYEASSLDSDEEGDNWLGAELAVLIKGKHRLLLFSGRERGGLKCTSGVCRPVQPFEGIRVTYEGRF